MKCDWVQEHPAEGAENAVAGVCYGTDPNLGVLGVAVLGETRLDPLGVAASLGVLGGFGGLGSSDGSEEACRCRPLAILSVLSDSASRGDRRRMQTGGSAGSGAGCGDGCDRPRVRSPGAEDVICEPDARGDRTSRRAGVAISLRMLGGFGRFGFSDGTEAGREDRCDRLRLRWPSSRAVDCMRSEATVSMALWQGWRFCLACRALVAPFEVLRPDDADSTLSSSFASTSSFSSYGGRRRPRFDVLGATGTRSASCSHWGRLS